jgi:cytochrome c1
MNTRAAVTVTLALCVALCACEGGAHAPAAFRVATGGSPKRGEHALIAYGCGNCHTIPGVRGARGLVGPPLTDFARRSFIAGRLPNAPDNLIRWILNPQAVDDRTAMPMLNVRPGDARDIAAYLYTLR